MDILIGKLNQDIASKISGGSNAQPGVSAPKFAEVLDTKRANPMDKLGDILSANQSADPKVLSAQSVQINRLDVDVEKSTNFDPKTKVSELFGNLNQDMGNMDSLVEILSDPKTKLSTQEMIGCQFFMHQATFTLETGSKGMQQLSQNINTILNTNVG